LLIEDETWRRLALCRDRALVPDPDIFHGEDFPQELGSEVQMGPEWGRIVAEAVERNHERERQAQLICSDCVVREACLEDNLHEKQGVWGGTTPEERARLRAGADIRSFRSQRAPRNSPSRDRVVALFREGLRAEDVAIKAGIGRQQVMRYLADHIALRQASSPVKFVHAA
jgi:hypothetical protein